MEAVGGGGGVLVSNNCVYNKTQQHHFWNFILMTQCKLRARRRQSRKRGRWWGRCSIYRHRTTPAIFTAAVDCHAGTKWL